MGTPYIGEIRMFAGNFPPSGWMFCEGQVLPISEYEALFSLIGTTYGGNGQTIFQLPDLRGRVPIHQGNGFVSGQPGGVETVALTVAQLPSHSHPMQASSDPADSPNPSGRLLSEAATTTPYFQGPTAVPLAPASILPSGGNGTHDNRQPYLCVNFIIAVFGIFPSQS